MILKFETPFSTKIWESVWGNFLLITFDAIQLPSGSAPHSALKPNKPLIAVWQLERLTFQKACP